MSWSWIFLAIAACFALKLCGLLVPVPALDRPAVARVAAAVPVALLAALIAIQTFTADRQVTLDARALGIAAAAVAVWLRAPFLVVVMVAAAVTAALRWLDVAG